MRGAPFIGTTFTAATSDLPPFEFAAVDDVDGEFDAIRPWKQIWSPGNSIGFKDEVEYFTGPLNSFQRLMRAKSTLAKSHYGPPVNKDVLISRLRAIPIGGNYLDLPADLMPTLTDGARNKDLYGRIGEEDLVATLLTRQSTQGAHYGRVIHPTQHRTMSLREAARMQGFPDHINLPKSFSVGHKLVGNAIGVNLVAALAREFLESRMSLDTAALVDSTRRTELARAQVREETMEIATLLKIESERQAVLVIQKTADGKEKKKLVKLAKRVRFSVVVSHMI